MKQLIKNHYYLYILFILIGLTSCSGSSDKEKIDKNTARERYSQALKYLTGDGVRKDTVYAKQLLYLASEGGEIKARKILRKLNHETPLSLSATIVEEAKYEWASREGPLIGKICVLSGEGIAVAFMGSLVELLQGRFSWLYIVGLLLAPIIITIYLIIFSYYGKVETGYNKWIRLRISAIPTFFIIYGIYGLVVGGISQDAYWTLGRLVFTTGHTGFWAKLTLFLNWALLASIVYGIVTIIIGSTTISSIFRILGFVFMCLFSLFAGTAGSIIIAIILAIMISKGIIFTPSGISGVPVLANSNESKKVDCREKTISGGCNLNNGFSCHKEKGSSCPYGVK